jgi:hypothetical protein
VCPSSNVYLLTTITDFVTVRLGMCANLMHGLIGKMLARLMTGIARFKLKLFGTVCVQMLCRGEYLGLRWTK